MYKNLLTVVLLFLGLQVFSQVSLSPFQKIYINTVVTFTDPYQVQGVTLDGTSNWDATNIAIGDTLFSADGGALMQYVVTSINSASGTIFDIVIDDVYDTGNIPVIDEYAFFQQGHNGYTGYVAFIGEPLQSLISKKTAEKIAVDIKQAGLGKTISTQGVDITSMLSNVTDGTGSKTLIQFLQNDNVESSAIMHINVSTETVGEMLTATGATTMYYREGVTLNTYTVADAAINFDAGAYIITMSNGNADVFVTKVAAGGISDGVITGLTVDKTTGIATITRSVGGDLTSSISTTLFNAGALSGAATHEIGVDTTTGVMYYRDSGGQWAEVNTENFIKGTYKDDAAAAAGGVQIGEVYEVDYNSTYHTAGTLVRRKE